MNSLRTVLLLLGIFLMSGNVAGSPFAGAGRAMAKEPCPAEAEIEAQLSQRRENLVGMKSGLDRLMSGRANMDASPLALFTVDLKDEAAVARRIDELKNAVGASAAATTKPEMDPVLACALEGVRTRQQAESVLSLEREVDALRLKFLEMPRERREAILRPQVDAAKQKEDINSLKAERNSAIQEKEQAKKSLDLAEEKSLSERTQDLRNLAAERAILEKFKGDLATLRIKSTNSLEEQAKGYREAAKRLSEIEGRLDEKMDTDEIRNDYREAVRIWRDLVDNSFRDSSTSLYTSRLPDLPEYPEALLKKMGELAEAKDYIRSYREARQQRDDLPARDKLRFEQNIDLHYRLLLQAGTARATLLNELLRRGDTSPVAFSAEYFQDFKRELKVVPYRWAAIFYVKALDIRHKMSQGLDGFVVLIKQALSFLAFMVIPVIFWLVIKRLISSVSDLRLWLVERRDASTIAGPLAVWIQRLIPYLPWVGILLAVDVAQSLIEKTVFSELTILLPYVSFYSYCRIFQLVVSGVFSAISLRAQITALCDIQPKLHQNTRTLGFYLFISLSLVHAIRSMISQGLIYRFTVHVVYLGAAIVLIWVLRQWSGELAAMIRHYMPGRIGGKFSRGLQGRFSLIWCLPGFMMAAMLLLVQWMKKWSEQFETYKKISATIFRRKLESAANQQNDKSGRVLPPDYRQWFSFDVPEDGSLLIATQYDPLAELSGTIEEWISGNTDEHSAVIYGDNGAGKSCLLERLAGRTASIEVLAVSVPAKLTSREAVLSFFEKLMTSTLPNGSLSLLEIDARLPRTLILIDEAHNLFLGKVGGFEGFKAFLDLVNAPTRNLYWLAAFNRYAWSYLHSVFGRKPYVSLARKLPAWTDADIKELIMNRHRRTDYRLSYDEIISAAGKYDRTGGVLHAESGFFRMLWQQSDGNPRAALNLWLSALKYSGPERLKVGLPRSPEAGLLGELPEDTHFVYAQIVRHENLSAEEAVQSTNLPESVVRHALKLGLEMRLLDCSAEGRYRIAPMLQSTLIAYLSGRNFIYGQ